VRASSDSELNNILTQMNGKAFESQLQAQFNLELRRRRLSDISITVINLPPAPPPPLSTPKPSTSFCINGEATCADAIPVLFQSLPYYIDSTKPFNMTFAFGISLAIPLGAWPAGETRPLQVLVLDAGPNSTYGSAVGRMQGASLAGKVAYFMPSGISFLVPVAIALDLDSGFLLPSGKAMAVYRFNATSRQWETRQSCPSTAAGKACGLTSTFSAYAPISAPPAGGGGGGGNACGDGCIAGAVIGSVVGVALLIFIVYWVVFRDTGAKPAPPAGITPDQAREEGRAQAPPESRAVPATDLSKRAAEGAEAPTPTRPTQEARVAAPDESEWDV
jgi:hypothetical protein